MRDGYRVYLFAFIAFDVASQIQSVAVSWQVYSVRHSAFDLGLVGLVLFAPALLLAPVTGFTADRLDRRAIMAAAMLTEVAISLALIPLFTARGTTALLLVLALLALAGIARAFAFPAEQSLLPAVVPAEKYVRASALASAIREFTRIGGPALGGLLIAIGPLPAYGTVGVIALAAACAVVTIPLLTRPSREEAPSLREAFAGLRFIRERPVLGGAIALDLFAVLFGGATALLPVYASDVFHVGAAGFGVLRAAPAFGTGICALIIARRPIHRYAGPRLLSAVACFGAATVAFGLSTSIWIAIPALALIGAADMVSVAIRDALISLGTPDAMRGRVTAVESVFITASNELGEFESGTLAALIGAVPTVVAGGLATLAIVGLWTWRNPQLRRADRILTP
ncbi:MAG TPA: MFS transporter [Candidatus Elarobacter sp.]|jgi:MFS family permease|nr:MFS transporter [Candidatus Elarobacter sp.]